MFMRAFPRARCDVMIESKSKDVALLRLRRDLSRFAPDIAERFGVSTVHEEPAVALAG